MKSSINKNDEVLPLELDIGWHLITAKPDSLWDNFLISIKLANHTNLSFLELR